MSTCNEFSCVSASFCLYFAPIYTSENLETTQQKLLRWDNRSIVTTTIDKFWSNFVFFGVFWFHACQSYMHRKKGWDVILSNANVYFRDESSIVFCSKFLENSCDTFPDERNGTNDEKRIENWKKPNDERLTMNGSSDEGDDDNVNDAVSKCQLIRAICWIAFRSYRSLCPSHTAADAQTEARTRTQSNEFVSEVFLHSLCARCFET